MDTNIKKLGDNPAASDFSFTVTTPLEPGTYTLDYRTRQFSKLFDAEPLDLTKPPPPAVAEIMDGLQGAMAELRSVEPPARLSDHDLIEIARTIAAMATARERMTLEELQTAPCPLDPGSPLVRAARAACVERGYGIDGEKGGGGNG